MASYPLEGTVLLAAKDNVRLYVNASKTSTRSDQVYNWGETIGTATGEHISSTAGNWFKVSAIVQVQKRNPWLLAIPAAGPFLYASTTQTANTTNDFWMRVEDGDFVIQEDASSDAASAAAAAAAKKEAQKQALIDAVTKGGSNPNLTANGGLGTGSNNWVWYLVGGVLVFVAGLVVWKLGQNKKRQSTQTPRQLAGIKKPKRLK